VTAQQLVRGDVAVLVPAAGMGVRLGSGGPKALRLLAGEPLLVHAVREVASAPSVGCVVVAAPPGEVGFVEQLLAVRADHRARQGRGVRSPVVEVKVVAGGAIRQESVALALAAVPDRFEIILVHDAARALAPGTLVESVAAAVRAGRDAVIPVLPVVDTIKEVAATGTVVGTVDRSVLRAVQTPQGFRRAILAAAHASAADEHTDDAGMVEKLGVRVHTVPGDGLAFKITRPMDLVVAEALVGRTLAV
jgi:2-C-methyl-D-erythritol 4-phosphate cytidylyltransferase